MPHHDQAPLKSARTMNRAFKPKDEGFEKRIRASFARQEIMKTVNASILSIEPGEVVLEFPYQTSLTQQHGFIHAGIVSTVLDSACGYAAFSLMPKGASVLSIEFKINLLSPANGKLFRAVGTVRKPGRNITVTEGEVFGDGDGGEKLLATMVCTIMTVYDREDV